jgi:hypothetical protein
MVLKTSASETRENDRPSSPRCEGTILPTLSRDSSPRQRYRVQGVVAEPVKRSCIRGAE